MVFFFVSRTSKEFLRLERCKEHISVTRIIHRRSLGCVEKVTYSHSKYKSANYNCNQLDINLNNVIKPHCVVSKKLWKRHRRFLEYPRARILPQLPGVGLSTLQ